MGHTQDTLAFASGRVWQVEITRTSEVILEYVKDGDTLRIRNKEVFEYKQDGQWYYIDPKTYKPIAKDAATFVYEKQLMTKDNPEASRKFKLGLTGNFSVENFITRSTRNLYFQLNPVVRIEPEFVLSEKLSIKVPVVIGFGYSNDQNAVQLDNYPEGSYYYAYSINYNEPRTVTAGELYFRTINNSDALPVYSNQYLRYYNTSWSSYTSTSHTYELIGQLGASLKWYPLGEYKKNSFYISNSLNVGLGNMNQVNYYVEFDTLIVENGANEFVPIWTVSKDSIVSNRKVFPYFRYEFALGLDLNIKNNWGISMELGYSTPIHFGLVPKDNVFVKSTFGEDYVLSGQPSPKFSRPDWSIVSGSPVARIALYYRFGEKLVRK